VVGPDEDLVSIVHVLLAFLLHAPNVFLNPTVVKPVQESPRAFQVLKLRPGALRELIGGGLDVIRPCSRVGDPVEVSLVPEASGERREASYGRTLNTSQPPMTADMAAVVVRSTFTYGS
jgi:hypothetical protein